MEIFNKPVTRNQAYPATRAWDTGKGNTATKRTPATRAVFASASIATVLVYNRATLARTAAAFAPATTFRKPGGSHYKGLKDPC